MTAPTTADMNRVIALFDGYEEYEDSDGTWFKKDGQITCMHIKLQNLEYHTDYNWLMSVWVKFRDMRLNTNNIKLADKFFEHKERVGENISFDSHAKAHKALYEAITWYQNLKK